MFVKSDALVSIQTKFLIMIKNKLNQGFTFVELVVAMIIGYVVAGRVDISLYDIFLGFLAGFFQVGFGFIFITIGARSTPSAVVGVIMMSEAIFGPLWAWIFINEQPPLIVLIGGSIVLFAVLLQFGSKFFIKKEVN